MYVQPNFSPRALGLPPKFARYAQPYQWDAVHRALGSPAKFVGEDIPPGGGKSLVAISVALLIRARGQVVILTSTKAHQDQLNAEFGRLKNVVDMRGHNAYECDATQQADGTWECDAFNCAYREAKRAAEAADVVITNYTFWLFDNLYSHTPALSAAKTLICDDAHLAFQATTRSLSPTISTGLMREYWPESLPDDVDGWRMHLDAVLVSVLEALIGAEKAADADMKRHNAVTGEVARRLKYYKTIRDNCVTITKRLNIGEHNWVIQYNGDKTEVCFQMVWMDDLAKRYLFPSRLEKVLLQSATLTLKTLQQLGITDDELEIIHYPSVFLRERNPVYYMPTVSLRYKSGQGVMNQLVAKMDNIMRSRLDRKGIIHSISYERAWEIKNKSRYGQHMIAHNPKEVNLGVRAFKQSSAPAILISPSVGTGFDFPGRDAEYVIIPKLPWPFARTPIMERRNHEDDEYIANMIMQGLIQMAGRAMRRTTDLSEVFILDDQWKWFGPKYAHLATPWFYVRTVESIPKPPPALVEG